MAVKKFTKSDITDSLYEKTKMNRKDIRQVMDCFIDELKDALIDGYVIELRGFGTFEVRMRKARKKARNPKTGQTVSTNSYGSVAFRPGRELKRDVKAVTCSGEDI